MAKKKISQERKAVYYFGMFLIIIGFLTFGSLFLSAAMDSGDHSNFEDQDRSMALRGIIGMGMMIFGGVLMGIGSRGLAGSGVILDPEKAREDIEPWSRMAGGVIKDAIDETDLFKKDKPGNGDLPFDEKLRRLHKLYEDGLIDEQEYKREKKEILDNN
jgi:hypothetical protein